MTPEPYKNAGQPIEPASRSVSTIEALGKLHPVTASTLIVTVAALVVLGMVAVVAVTGAIVASVLATVLLLVVGRN